MWGGGLGKREQRGAAQVILRESLEAAQCSAHTSLARTLVHILSCKAVGECGLYSGQLCTQLKFRSFVTMEEGGEGVLGSMSSVHATS